MRTNDHEPRRGPRWALARVSELGAGGPYVRAGLITASVAGALALLCLVVAAMVPTAAESQDLGLSKNAGTAVTAVTAAPTVPAVPPVALTEPAVPPVTSSPAPVTPPPTVPPPSVPPTSTPPSVAPTSTPPAAPDPPVVVASQVAWTDTGIDVSPGDLVHFSATGTVLHAAPDPSTQVGPAGDPDAARAAANLQVNGVPMGGNHSGLIGRIGDGEPFVLGQAGTIGTPSEGRLFLGVNDNGLDNNEGEFDVAITVQRG